MLLDIVGWIGVIILVPATWFQVLKDFQHKSTAGVSVLTFGAIFLGTFILFFVSFFDGSSLPIQAQFALGAVGSAVVLFQVRHYRARRHT